MQSVLQNLPVGWRFSPTNEEVLHYLKNKRLGHPIGGSDIQDIQICGFDPWDLIDNDSPSEERYFFCLREFSKKSGEDSDEVIGTKTIFVYHDPNPTEFVKHEYELTEELNSPVQDDNDFVLCKLMINKKKKANKKPKKDEPLSVEKAAVNSTQIEVNYKKKGSVNSKQLELDSNKKEATSSFQQKQANSACDKGEPSNHATSDFEYQNGSNVRAHMAFGEGEPIIQQTPISVTRVSTFEKGESSHHGAYEFEYQNKYEMSNTSFCDQGITSFLMESDLNLTCQETSFLMTSDFNQNSMEISTLSSYSMSDTSSQMIGYLENHNPNDSTTISLHGRSPTSFENQISSEITVFSTHKHVETSCLVNSDYQNSNRNDTTLYSASNDQSDTNLYTSCSNQNELSNPVTFSSKNQNPSKEIIISTSLQGRCSLLEETPLDFEWKKTDRLDSEYSSSPLLASTVPETEFEAVESQYKKMEVSNLADLQDVTLPEINSQLLGEITCLDDLMDTLSSEP